jgi:hypothetical protein
MMVCNLRAKAVVLRETISPCRREEGAKMDRKKLIVSSVLFVLILALPLGVGLYCYSEWEDYDYVEAPVPLITPTSYPRLEESEAQAIVAKLLETNGECRFPYWWGIVPGKTTWEEVHAQLSPLTGYYVDRSRNEDGHEVTYGYYGPLSGIYVDIRAVDDLPVPDIFIEIPPERLSNLRLSGILQTYGKPAEINIISPHREIGLRGNCLGEFEIFLYYPDNEFIAHYLYRPYMINKTIRVCELDEPFLAEFYVWDSTHSINFQEESAYGNWDVRKNSTKTIEDRTEWSVESFYETFRSGAGPDLCITVPPYVLMRNNRYPGCKGDSP